MKQSYAKFESELHRESIACALEGCQQTTSLRKPYCAEHVDELPYARALIEVLIRQTLEEERVARFGSTAVNLQGLTVEQLLQHLDQHGPTTTTGLGRALFLSESVVFAYALSLADAGLVCTRRGSKGKVLISLTSERARRAS
jgi:DNA-binding transcriptional ArsR family regulator